MKTDAAVAEQYRDTEKGAERLAQIGLFKKFTRPELRTLYSKGRFENLRPLSNAVIEGEPTRGLYVILEGTVSVYKTDPESGALSRLAVLEAGAYFGELSLFDTSSRSATVTAETSCHCFVLDAEAFHQYLTKSGENLQLRFYKTCAEDLVDRFRKLNSDYINSQNMLWRYAFRHTD